MRFSARFAVPAVAAAGLFAAATANAAVLEQYEFVGQPGNETSVAATNVLAGLSGVTFGETGVTPVAAADSINASGFTSANSYFSFGFNVLTGFTATLNQLAIATRSSGTGPGTVNLLASVDGGAFTTVATFTQSGTTTNNQTLALTPLTATSSLLFRLVSANQTSASGGTVGAGGTFRVADYQTSTPVTLTGTVARLTAAVPEPASWAMMVGGFALVGGALRRRSRAFGVA